MAVVRDPSFWKRFSMAVHLDEERNAAVSSSDRPELKHTYVPFAQTMTQRGRAQTLIFIPESLGLNANKRNDPDVHSSVGYSG